MPDAFPPPLSSLDPADWLVFSDWLLEYDGTRHASRRAERARRIAAAVAAGVRLVLVERPAHPLGENLAFLNPRSAADPKFWDKQLRISITKNHCRWWTPEEYKKERPWVRLWRFLTTPADFPGLVSEAPRLAWLFFLKAARVRAREEKEVVTP